MSLSEHQVPPLRLDQPSPVSLKGQHSFAHLLNVTFPVNLKAGQPPKAVKRPLYSKEKGHH